LLSRQAYVCMVTSAVILIVTSFIIVFPPITYSSLLIVFFTSLMTLHGNAVVKKINMNSFEAERTVSKEFCNINEEIKVILKITNKTKTPLYIIVEDEVDGLDIERGSAKIEKTLKGGETLELIYVVKARRRGVYSIGPLNITVFDKYRYGARKIYLDSKAYIYAYPVDNRNIKLADMMLYTERKALFGSAGNYVTGIEETFRTLREYEPSDPARRIYWKKSGKEEHQIFVREFDKLNRMEVYFLVDCSPSMLIGYEPSLLDEVIGNLTVLIRALVRKGDYVTVKTLGAINDLENLRIYTSSDYTVLIKRMAELKPKEGFKLRDAAIKIRRKPDVLIIVSRFAYFTPEELKALMKRLNQQRIRAYLILVRKKLYGGEKSIVKVLEEVEDRRIEDIKRACPSIIVADSTLLTPLLSHILNSIKKQRMVWTRQ